MRIRFFYGLKNYGFLVTVGICTVTVKVPAENTLKSKNTGFTFLFSTTNLPGIR